MKYVNPISQVRCLSLILILGTMGTLVACGQSETGNSTLDPNSVVVRSTASFQITTQNTTTNGSTPSSPVSHSMLFDGVVIKDQGGVQSITVTNNSQTTMTLDNSLFGIPPISQTLLDFGYLQLGSLLDNDLNLCGSNGHTKCTTALIRMYTTGTPAAGLYNTTDSYGLPILAGQVGQAMSTVGLNVAGATVLQSISIPSSRHTVKLSDFPNPKYNVKIDFTDAGAGTFSTTLVVEYGLAP